MIVAPPDVPADRAQALRDAFDKATHDRELIRLVGCRTLLLDQGTIVEVA